MPTRTLTGDLHDVIDDDLDRARAYLFPVAAAIVESGTRTVRLGGYELTLASDLTFTVAALPLGTYRLRVDFANAASKWRPQTWTSPPFAFTTNVDIDFLI